MGFWKSLFGIEEKRTDDKEEKKSEFDTTFVTRHEEKKFEESLYGTLQLYSADIEYISEVLPERGENLEKQIKLLIEILEKTNNEDSPDVRSVFRDLKSQFEEDKRLADGEYTISELENQNQIMDKVFDTSIYNDGITKEKLEQYIDFISKIQKKIAENEDAGYPLLTKVQKQKFNSISMKSEYRIKMLELMYLLKNYNGIKVNPFKDLSPIKQKMFSKMFYEDAKKAANQYKMLSYMEEEFNEYNPNYFQSIDNMAKELNHQMATVRMIDDFSIAQLFDSSDEESKSFEFLKRFIKFKMTLNDMDYEKIKIPQILEEKRIRSQEEEERRKQKEEAIEAEKRKEQEELEKLKAYTDVDMRREIYKIEHDLTAEGSRFVNILEFQKKVARAKGLLETEEHINNDGISYKAVDFYTAWEIIKKANTLGISYAAFPDCQESKDGGILFVVPKAEDRIFNVDNESVNFRCLKNDYHWHTDEEIGEYPGFVLNRLDEMLGNMNLAKNWISVSNNGILYEVSIGYNMYEGKESRYDMNKENVYRCLNIIKNELGEIGKSPEDLQDVMCYISVPATRNIIPILEEFKKAGVSSYIEPMLESNSRNTNRRNNIQIYFERDDLEKVKDVIMENISNPIVGIATLNWDNKSLGSAIRDEFSWPQEKIVDR